MTDTYRKDIDLLKGLAILAVVFYHAGVFSSGWLGVDIFFVINGFLILPKMIRQISAGEFRYFCFLRRRLVRLWPLVLIAGGVSLLIGYFVMLPDDYENLAESVVASSIFSNNILATLTTKNYWAIGNDYSPLMHMWYLGILLEFYLVTPLILLLFRLPFRHSKQLEKIQWGGVMALIITSLALYIIPHGSSSDKFYLLQYRFWEIALGGVFWKVTDGSPRKTTIKWGSMGLMIAILAIACFTMKTPRVVPVGESMAIHESPVLKALFMFATVLLTGSYLGAGDDGFSAHLKILPLLGKMSFSIYVWHQVILAFYRYCISTEYTVWGTLAMLAVLSLLSSLTWRFFEQGMKDSWLSLGITAGVCVVLLFFALNIYANAGVVRDVPELDITKGNTIRGMHAAYCDRVFSFDKDFPADSDRENVLVAGVSYGRDFANILLESDYSDSLNISYVYKLLEDAPEDVLQRIREADVIFTFQDKSKVPAYVWENVRPGVRVYGIGTKRYGNSNGQIYFNRFRMDDWHQQSAPAIPEYTRLNDRWKAVWGVDYVDLLTPVTLPDGSIRVFTDDNKFIAPDSRTGSLRFVLV